MPEAQEVPWAGMRSGVPWPPPGLQAGATGQAGADFSRVKSSLRAEEEKA